MAATWFAQITDPLMSVPKAVMDDAPKILAISLVDWIGNKLYSGMEVRFGPGYGGSDWMDEAKSSLLSAAVFYSKNHVSDFVPQN